MKSNRKYTENLRNFIDIKRMQERTAMTNIKFAQSVISICNFLQVRNDSGWCVINTNKRFCRAYSHENRFSQEGCAGLCILNIEEDGKWKTELEKKEDKKIGHEGYDYKQQREPVFGERSKQHCEDRLQHLQRSVRGEIQGYE